MGREGRCPACGEGLHGSRNARGRPRPRVRRRTAGGRGTPAGACEDRGPARAAPCVGRGTPAGGRCPARGGGLREARGGCEDRCPACAAGGRGTPAGAARTDAPRVAAACWRPAGAARTDAPRVRRPAWVAERPRGTDALCVRRAAGGRGTPAGACEDRGPARAATCVGRGTPAGGRCPARGGDLRNPRGRPMPRVCGGLREACRTPARADAPGAQRRGGTHSASPQTVEQSFARGLPGRGSAGPSARRDRPPANPAACAVNQAS